MHLRHAHRDPLDPKGISFYSYRANPSWRLDSETSRQAKSKTDPLARHGGSGSVAKRRVRSRKNGRRPLGSSSQNNMAPSSQPPVARSSVDATRSASSTSPSCDSGDETIAESRPTVITKWRKSKEHMKKRFVELITTFFQRVALASDIVEYRVENGTEVERWLEVVHSKTVEYSDHPPWAFIGESNGSNQTQPSTTEAMFYKLTTSIDRAEVNGVENCYNANLVGMHYHRYIRRKTHDAAGRYNTLFKNLAAGHPRGREAPLRDLRRQIESFIAWHEFCNICGNALIIHGINIFDYLYNYKTLYDAREVIEEITKFLRLEWNKFSEVLDLSRSSN